MSQTKLNKIRGNKYGIEGAAEGERITISSNLGIFVVLNLLN